MLVGINEKKVHALSEGCSRRIVVTISEVERCRRSAPRYLTRQQLCRSRRRNRRLWRFALMVASPVINPSSSRATQSHAVADRLAQQRSIVGVLQSEGVQFGVANQLKKVVFACGRVELSEHQQ